MTPHPPAAPTGEPAPPPPLAAAPLAAAPTKPRRDLLGQTIVGDGPWSTATRDRFVAALFLTTGVLLVLVIRPFLDALLFASATVVVTWPIYAAVLRRTGGRTNLAAALTATSIAVLVLAPVSLLGMWLLHEVVAVAEQTAALVDGGELKVRMAAVRDMVQPLLDELQLRTGVRVDPMSLVEPLQRATVAAGQSLARTLPEWVGSVFVAALDGFVYLFAVVTLYARGPQVLQGVMNVSPLREEHDHRLFEVFREFSSNLVVGAVTTAVVQGLVSLVGYSIAGVPNLVLVSLLTTVFGFVPIVGTAVIWVPVTFWVWSNHGPGWGLFLLLWSVGLTGSVDNLLRPFLLRGRSQIHPLLIFVSVLGGIAWMGFPGALVGPVIMAMFLTLHQIWNEVILPGPS